jgi:hypothetical protein
MYDYHSEGDIDAFVAVANHVAHEKGAELKAHKLKADADRALAASIKRITSRVSFPLALVTSRSPNLEAIPVRTSPFPITNKAAISMMFGSSQRTTIVIVMPVGVASSKVAVQTTLC